MSETTGLRKLLYDERARSERLEETLGNIEEDAGNILALTVGKRAPRHGTRTWKYQRALVRARDAVRTVLKERYE